MSSSNLTGMDAIWPFQQIQRHFNINISTQAPNVAPDLSPKTPSDYKRNFEQTSPYTCMQMYLLIQPTQFRDNSHQTNQLNNHESGLAYQLNAEFGSSALVVGWDSRCNTSVTKKVCLITHWEEQCQRWTCGYMDETLHLQRHNPWWLRLDFTPTWLLIWFELCQAWCCKDSSEGIVSRSLAFFEWGNR